MLPDILAGSYQRYKADTNTFTTFDPTPEIPPSSKSIRKKKAKARKVAREIENAKQENANPEAIRYTITTRDLLEQAQVVAGRVEAPDGLRHGLRRAIQARQRCAEWFRTSKENILVAAPKLFKGKRSYDAIAIVIFYAGAFGQSQDPKAQMASNDFLRPTPFDDFIYLSTAKILMKYDYVHSFPRKPSYPLPSAPLRADFVSRPDLLGTPYMDKKELEDALLSQLMIDLSLFDDLAQGSKESGVITNPPPAEDELSLGLSKLRTQGHISVWLVFAARIFLDLQDILGKEIKRGQNDLRAIACNVDTVLKSTGAFPNRGGDGWLMAQMILPQTRQILIE
ncbi:hypothetical protein B0J14DRAFT_615901 [Halenospora varia]|nr:hypothetical protein B0J14DRAFT_615901 [Halenospora varia]